MGAQGETLETQRGEFRDVRDASSRRVIESYWTLHWLPTDRAIPGILRSSRHHRLSNGTRAVEGGIGGFCRVVLRQVAFRDGRSELRYVSG